MQYIQFVAVLRFRHFFIWKEIHLGSFETFSKCHSPKKSFPNLAKHCLKEMLRKVILGLLLCPRLRNYVHYYSTHHNPILQSCLTKKMLKDH